MLAGVEGPGSVPKFLAQLENARGALPETFDFRSAINT
jgi:hypothetical protein